jgi:hypothetical protein
MDEDTELTLTPVDDMLDRDRRRFGLNVWLGVGILGAAFALFLLGAGPLKLVALALGIGLPVATWAYTRKDPQRLVLLWINLFLYSYYDPGKRPTRGQRFLQWLRP